MAGLLHLFILVAAAPAADEVGVELTTYGASDQASGTVVLSPIFSAELGDERWTACVDWGFVYLGELSDEDGFGRFRLGNPAISALTGFDWLGGLWRVGAGGSLPFARLDEGVEGRRRDRNTLAHASGVRGNRDLWLWAPERGSVFVPAEATWRLPRGWIGGEVAGALLVPMGSFASGRYDVVLQAAAAAAYTGSIVEGGVRGQVVVVATQPRDRLQWSVAPFVAVDLGRARLRLELLMPLGDPLGALGLWSLAAGVEVTL